MTACVVSDFDDVRQRKSAAVVEAGVVCDLDAASSAAALCTGETELDAASDEGEPSELDTGAQASDADAGTSANDAGATAETGADAASASGADARAPEGGANSCADVVRDPENCGACGVSCSATGARVSCENMRCVRACQDGYGDCNSDLQLGMMGNGCERRIDDALNCGECRRRCLAPSNGYATCDKQLCNGHSLALTEAQPGTVYGSSAGGMGYDHFCPEGSVLVGIDGTGTDIVYGIGARCAPLKVTQTSGTVTVSTGTVTDNTLVGGLIDPPPPRYRRECPPGSFVTGISGTLWTWPGATVLSVRSLTLACGSARVGADRKVSIVAGPTYTIGDEAASPLVPFSRQCSAPGAATGINGRAGAYLDSIAVTCSKLAVFSAPVGSATSAN